MNQQGAIPTGIARREHHDAQAPKNAMATTEKKPRPIAGFLIAGGALVALFGLVALKARVK